MNTVAKKGVKRPSGPAAYNVKDSIASTQPPVSVFGTSRRENEANRYISSLHNASLPSPDTPGPGTYRAHMFDRSSRSPKRGCSPSWRFGTGPQRPDEAASEQASIPGPIYQIPDSLSHLGTQFGPEGGPNKGITRSRSDAANIFISKQHAESELPAQTQKEYSVVGPKYDTSNYGVLKKASPSIKFGTTTRDSLDSQWQQQLKVNPESTTAIQTPAANYSYEDCSTISKIGTKFGTGPRSYGWDSDPNSPNKGLGKGPGPYIGRLHEHSQLGTQSPGPCAYGSVVDSPRSKAVGGWIGDSPKYSFGTAPQTQPLKPSLGPGPGAYSPHDEPLSQVHAAPAYNMGANLRTDFTAFRDKEVPGPGAYEVGAALTEGHKSRSPAYSLGRNDNRPLDSRGQDTPGPGAYNYSDDQPASREGSPSRVKGYTFGGRERRVNPMSTVGVRCHGPLAAQETLGLASPGPGLYNVRDAQDKLSPKRRLPDVRFGQASKAVGPKIYISKLHAETEGCGMDSPGPGVYDSNQVELAKVTSKYSRAPAATFSTSKRM
ncbi:hypothetical protein DUNSADRAFT_17853 [Dunaliella salina]|uniref:Flagellar associated protein n=1 Tax=Dunaliella salina TaxID=3046 RepID=A0ABQ7G120_DUNSA|nr:hypothetical protein DUNSADRAFT_17853 [Dunaliella salina]|eukprot:KAF5828291.1 hypothetical protein DUNSADRAFT_17853 [Dunaliella salina]